jgi:hypothetical protein
MLALLAGWLGLNVSPLVPSGSPDVKRKAAESAMRRIADFTRTARPVSDGLAGDIPGRSEHLRIGLQMNPINSLVFREPTSISHFLGSAEMG